MGLFDIARDLAIAKRIGLVGVSRRCREDQADHLAAEVDERAT